MNVPIKNKQVGLSSDADILLKNGDIIEVKSGGGKGATTQVSNQYKKRSPFATTGEQANFETFSINPVTGARVKTSNAHLNISK